MCVRVGVGGGQASGGGRGANGGNRGDPRVWVCISGSGAASNRRACTPCCARAPAWLVGACQPRLPHVGELFLAALRHKQLSSVAASCLSLERRQCSRARGQCAMAAASGQELACGVAPPPPPPPGALHPSCLHRRPIITCRAPIYLGSKEEVERIQQYKKELAA